MEPGTLTDIFRALHIFAAMLVAWPYYALAAVNQRVRLGPPLGDRTDRYMENILKSRTTACFVFQFTLLAGGFALIAAHVHDGLFDGDWYLTNKVVVAKIVILLLMAASLSWVRFVMQPEIDRRFGDFGELSDEDKNRIMVLRLRRKRMSGACMFLAFGAALLGLQVYVRFEYWLTAVVAGLLAAWAWRSYRSTTPFGWF